MGSTTSYHLRLDPVQTSSQSFFFRRGLIDAPAASSCCAARQMLRRTTGTVAEAMQYALYDPAHRPLSFVSSFMFATSAVRANALPKARSQVIPVPRSGMWTTKYQG